MDRYLAIVPHIPRSDPTLRERLCDRLGLVCTLDRPELLLLIPPDVQTIAFASGTAVVIGHLFDGDGGGPAAAVLDRQCQQAVEATQGQWLIDRLWGAYVAFFCRDGATLLVRDPAAGIGCYYLQRDGVTVIASDIGLLEAAGLLSHEIDWSFIAGQLLSPELRPRATGYMGLKELFGGERLRIVQRRLLIETSWSPWAFAAAKNAIRDPQEAAQKLRETVMATIGAMASRHRKIALGVSGGLDSSIVAACLAESGVDFACVTMATGEPAGDERVQARMVAEAFDAELYEAFERIDSIDVRASHASHLPRPVARLFAQSADRYYRAFAPAHGIDAYMTGGGGDNVFAFFQSASQVADRLIVEGPGWGVLATAIDICAMAQCSLPTVLAGAVHRALFRARGYPWPVEPLFLTPAALALATPPAHPWLDPAPGALPGKATHIAWVLGFQNHLEGFRRELERPILTPLMAQPVIELCLRIPSWMWCAGGRNRAIARDAFADLLPPAILARTSKGSPDGFAVQIFEANRPAIGETLREGRLAQRGLIDLNAIAPILRDAHPAQLREQFRIMQLVDVEAWLANSRATG
jgi:asparagine synthase (glutamine-hydrolysing)